MHDTDYCRDPAQVAVYADAADALHRLREHGLRLILITNQSGIGRGYFTEEDFQRVQAELWRQLGGDAWPDAVYHCPDPPERATDRRKPGPGMILAAARDHALDLPRSYMIGDKADDLEAGRRAGLAANVLVLTGKGRAQLAHCRPDFAAENLSDAADWILRHDTDFANHG